MGIRFRHLDPNSRDNIFQVVERFLQRGGEPLEAQGEVGSAIPETDQPARPSGRPKCCLHPCDTSTGDGRLQIGADELVLTSRRHSTVTQVGSDNSGE